jgi:hypothetical protein
MSHWLIDELRPRPGRVREASEIAVASTVALALALFLQFGAFPAPLLAFKALQPGVASTWRNLTPRMIAIVGSGVFVTVAVGLLVQLPWLLVPAFFALIVSVTYLVPIRAFPIGGYALAIILSGTVYSGVFNPNSIGASALATSVAFAIGLLVATVFEELGAAKRPRDRLSAALADTLTRARATMAAARARLDAAPIGGDTPALSDLSGHLQLLTLVRQDTHDRILDRAFVALMTVAERVNLFAAMADAAVRHPLRPRFSALLQPELDRLLDAIDHALGRYIDAAWQPESVVIPDDAAQRVAADWPDFSALHGAVQARHADPAMRAALPGIDVPAAAVLNGFLQSLDGLSDVLHLPPESLEHLPPEGPHPAPPPLLPPFDPFAFQFALKIGLATTLSLLVGIIAHAPHMETVVLNPLILAQGSYGATLRKAWLRITGVIAGGAVAVFIAVTVMPNTGDVGVWLMVFFLVLLPCAYISLGTVRFGYFGLQIAATFMIVMVADKPVTDTNLVLWRFWGTLVGAALLFSLFEIIAPDYAGRQLVSRFADLLRTLLASAPVPGQPVPSLTRAQALSDQITAGLADVLRLAGEARFEGAASGVNPEAAVNTAGLLRRIAHRWALIRRGRRHGEFPPLPAPLAAASAAVEHAARERLVRLLRILDARHHRARPGSQPHRAACAAARALATELPCDLAAPWRTYRTEFDAAREMMHDWPIAARESYYAESGHLQRIVELLPKLELEIARTILPGEAPGAAARWQLHPVRP